MIEKETHMTEQEIQNLIDRAIVAREKLIVRIPILAQVQLFSVRMGLFMKGVTQKMLLMA